MKLDWLNKQGNSSLILFFSGWNSSIDLFAHLDCGCFDVAHLSDYRELNTLDTLDAILTNIEYSEIIVIAWSFGVASAALCLQQCSEIAIKVTKKISINGSPIPVDKRLGIPQNIMQLTIDTLSARSLKKFQQRCGMLQSNSQLSDNDITQLKQELIAVNSRQYQLPDIPWDKAIISENDVIFSQANLERAWQKHAQKINIISAQHYPFKHWNSWAEIVDN